MNKFFVIVLALGLFSCTPYMDDNDGHMDSFFFVSHKGADMPVMVEGNIESKKFVIVVHGGPGGTGWSYNSGDAFTILEESFAFVYYDQRGSGGASGTGEGWDYSRDQYAEDLNVIIQVIKSKYGDDIELYLLGHSWGGELTTQFMINPEYQSQITGWINVGGGQWVSDDRSGRYIPMRNNLLQFASIEVQEGENLDVWQPIVDFCNQLDTNDFESWYWNELYDFAWDVTWKQMRNEGKIEDDVVDVLFDTSPGLESSSTYYSEDWYSGWLFSESPGQVHNTSTLSGVYLRENQEPYFNRISKPSLIIYGKYDLICPPQMGAKLYHGISTPASDKQFVVLDSADHAPWHRIDEFVSLVDNFVGK